MPAIIVETAPAPDTMERIPKPGDVKFEDGLKFVYREKPETFVDCAWHCGEICGMPCGIVKDTVDMIIAENQGLLLMSDDQAQEAKKIFQEHPDVITCTKSLIANKHTCERWRLASCDVDRTVGVHSRCSVSTLVCRNSSTGSREAFPNLRYTTHA